MTQSGPVIPRLLRDDRVRFLVIGGVNTVVGYGLFVFVQRLIGDHVSYFGSVLIAHLGASLLAFFLYRHWVFRVRGNLVVDFLRFQLVYVAPLLANLLALPFLVAVAGINVYLAQAMIVVVTSVVSYVGHKFFSFRRPIDALADPLKAASADV